MHMNVFQNESVITLGSRAEGNLEVKYLSSLFCLVLFFSTSFHPIPQVRTVLPHLFP